MWYLPLHSVDIYLYIPWIFTFTLRGYLHLHSVDIYPYTPWIFIYTLMDIYLYTPWILTFTLRGYLPLYSLDIYFNTSWILPLHSVDIYLYIDLRSYANPVMWISMKTRNMDKSINQYNSKENTNIQCLKINSYTSHFLTLFVSSVCPKYLLKA